MGGLERNHLQPVLYKLYWVWEPAAGAFHVEYTLEWPNILGLARHHLRYWHFSIRSGRHDWANENEQTVYEPMVTLAGENQNEKLQLPPSQIAYISAADNYVRVFFIENGQLKNQMLRTTMKKMEDAVAAHSFLFRCHRTFLVNMELVQKVSGNAQGYRLHLKGIEESIPVSRNLNDRVREMV
jgi:DNA-binding LytR/AlgR family response regulator